MRHSLHSRKGPYFLNRIWTDTRQLFPIFCRMAFKSILFQSCVPVFFHVPRAQSASLCLKTAE